MSSTTKKNFLDISNIPAVALTEQGFRLDHIDFVPKCLVKGTGFEISKFESFESLITRANEWLKAQTSIRVKMVETVIVNTRYGDVNPDDFQVYDRSVGALRFVRILRLWLAPSDPAESPSMEQLGYFTVMPKFIGKDRNDKPVHENLEETVKRLNTELLQSPLPGHIITVETQEISYAKADDIDVDSMTWDDLATRFLTILRVYYIVGPPHMDQIGMADFVPQHTGQGERAVAYYEDFNQLSLTARKWLSSQQGLRVCNIQSVRFRLPELNDSITYHSHRTSFSGVGQIRYARVLRVNFVISPATSTADTPTLNYKTFIPVWIERGSGPGNWKFESLAQTMNRIDMWLRCTGSKVLSVETVPIRMAPPFYAQSERTMTYHLKSGHYDLFAVRLYLDGEYKEPPANMLPPIPPEPQKDSCNIL